MTSTSSNIPELSRLIYSNSRISQIADTGLASKQSKSCTRREYLLTPAREVIETLVMHFASNSKGSSMSVTMNGTFGMKESLDFSYSKTWNSSVLNIYLGQQHFTSLITETRDLIAISSIIIQLLRRRKGIIIFPQIITNLRSPFNLPSFETRNFEM